MLMAAQLERLIDPTEPDAIVLKMRAIWGEAQEIRRDLTASEPG